MVTSTSDTVFKKAEKPYYIGDGPEKRKVRYKVWHKGNPHKTGHGMTKEEAFNDLNKK